MAIVVVIGCRQRAVTIKKYKLRWISNAEFWYKAHYLCLSVW